jgi:hypothetical protein
MCVRMRVYRRCIGVLMRYTFVLFAAYMCLHAVYVCPNAVYMCPNAVLCVLLATSSVQAAGTAAVNVCLHAVYICPNSVYMCPTCYCVYTGGRHSSGLAPLARALFR